MSKYTLVQHSGFGYGEKPGFEHAVEEHSVTDREAEKVRKLGGVIFDSYEQAYDAAEHENYPPEVDGVIPQAPGTFSKVLIDGLAVYLPPRRLVSA